MHKFSKGLKMRLSDDECMVRGISHPNSVLSEEQIRQIRDSKAQGLTECQIAAIHSISRGQVGRIVRGENWRHI